MNCGRLMDLCIVNRENSAGNLLWLALFRVAIDPLDAKRYTSVGDPSNAIFHYAPTAHNANKQGG